MRPATSLPQPLRACLPCDSASSSPNFSRRSSDDSRDSTSSLDRYDHPKSPSDVSWSSEHVGAEATLDIVNLRLPARLARRLMDAIRRHHAMAEKCRERSPEVTSHKPDAKRA